MTEADERGGRGRGNGEDAVPATSSSESRGNAASEPLLVLIVEDEAPIAEALSYIVSEAGYEPLVAAHGKEALEILESRRPGLVLTDLMMPHMDGAELIVHIHDGALMDGLVAPPIVLMTAAGMRRASEAGADAILRKPFALDEVEDLLRKYLGPPKGHSPAS